VERQKSNPALTEFRYHGGEYREQFVRFAQQLLDLLSGYAAIIP